MWVLSCWKAWKEAERIGIIFGWKVVDNSSCENTFLYSLNQCSLLFSDVRTEMFGLA